MPFLLHHFILDYRMNYLELDYQTWEREECYGMFDYSQAKNIKQHHKIIIKTSGKLYRDHTTFEMIFLQSQIRTPPPVTFMPFLKIQCNEGHFYIVNQHSQSENQTLSAIAPQKGGLRLKEGNKIRLGKAQLQLLRLNWTSKKRGNHYERIKQPILAQKQSIFASSFYSQKEKASLIETNPACRYCYSKTIDDKNPFMALCNCSGHTKYIHMSCLVEWVRKRSGILEDYPKGGVYCTQAKAFTCQVCKSFYRVDRLLRQVFGVSEIQLEEYAVFLINTELPLIYVIDLTKQNTVSIGRNLESQMVINQLSVSRKHCILNVDQIKQQLSVTDLSAKFGTVVQIQRTQINNKQEFQKGRTRMKFKMLDKLSFFQRIGFCSSQQTLRNEGRY